MEWSRSGVVLFDPRHDGAAGLGPGGEPLPGPQLELQGGVKRFGHGVVQDRPGTALRLGDPGRRADPGQRPAAELPALVGVQHHRGHVLAPGRDRDLHRGGRQIGVVMPAQGVPDRPARSQLDL